ncbi:peptidylprolyl isomerase [Candidatus Pacearchaeota archaeon]|nr:peptidylprolyl isomerase [Candidatus Pacearchaeota archaeon]
MAIKQGNKVKIEYEGKFETGEVFDSSNRGDVSNPIEFEVGAGKVIKGFDEAVIGMEEGQEKEFSMNPEDGYGEVKPELKKEVPRSALPEGQEPQVGMGLMMTAPTGQQIPAKIIEVDKEKIVLDLNHPLAGKKLNFKIKVVGISD